MNSTAFALSAFRGNAKIVGNEVAWRGTDISDIFGELAAASLAIVGVESVRFPSDDGRPMVEAISDRGSDLREWQQSLPWVHCVLRAWSLSTEDLERNVKEPYLDDVWYFVYAKNRSGNVLTADP